MKPDYLITLLPHGPEWRPVNALEFFVWCFLLTLYYAQHLRYQTTKYIMIISRTGQRNNVFFVS